MSGKKPARGKGNRRGSTRQARGTLKRFDDIENVIVEEPFSLYKPAGATGGGEEDRKAGDGCYVSATVQNSRRYYGVLVDQEAFKNASLLWFQEEAGSLELNRRMKHLLSQARTEESSNGKSATTVNGNESDPDGEKKRPATGGTGNDGEEAAAKRIKLESGVAQPDLAPTSMTGTMQTSGGGTSNGGATADTQKSPATTDHRQVQKFRYVEPADKNNTKDLGYRILLATFADVDAAADDDVEKKQRIDQACQSGGGFVGKYYYQYEVLQNSLQTAITIQDQADHEMRTSMGFDSFLHGTQLPKWFPLSNFQIGQQKVLSLLNMKKDNNGNVIWDAEAESTVGRAALQGTHVPMETRNHYRIGIIGGGISGLACALELLRQSNRDNIDLEVVIVEGRSRLGGRLLTDRDTFKRSNGAPFPVDLGAGWIHGIDHNPLASLAREAGVSFVTASEEVKMMHRAQREVDATDDENMGKLFDDLLDLGADDCWGTSETSANGARRQEAVRWYSANLGSNTGGLNGLKHDPFQTKLNDDATKHLGLKMTDAPPHRHSSDMSIDHAIGQAIAKHRFRDFAKLTKDQHLMLEWNMKNVEYALGANVSDLSMKFWDSDERHAFEGDHVLLREGYSTVVEYMLKQLEDYGPRKFKTMVNFSVGKIEYARRSTTQKYQDQDQRKLVELSDTCSITTEDGSQTLKCDFLVCTLPLGVLKHSVSDDSEEPIEEKVTFEPPLPYSKKDSISTVGFGLLDKLYLQFEQPFWRDPLGLEGDKYLFGNSTGVNPHFYMFTDLGLTMGSGRDAPPVLMSLISGKEAVHCEMLTEAGMVQEALATLREILAPIEVPDPIAVKRTQWGMDKFSRGCYTFLPPGATDQDFNMLQSPINGNGDSLVLEGSETMRMFFAGEHTTALHPSMAHGAMLSGIRAAKEIVSTLSFSFRNDKATDRLIPVALFRKDNPETPLQCSLCHEMGSRVREGSLLALKRGARQVLVHNNCAEFTPEVEVYEGQWMHVIKAVNRGRSLTCALCERSGATIGCTHPNCYRVYHFSCSEDTGWRFDREGKVYYCDYHRKYPAGNQADKISMKFYLSKTPGAIMRCFLCGGADEADKAGKLLAFQRKNRRVLVHEKCAHFTTLVDTKEDTESRMGVEYPNIFDVIQNATTCAKCSRHGATVGCSACDLFYHYPCALETGWKSDKRGSKFLCGCQRKTQTDGHNDSASAGMFQHALFAGVSTGSKSRVSMPSNSEMGGGSTFIQGADSHEEIVIDDSSVSEDSVHSNDNGFYKSSVDIPLTALPLVQVSPEENSTVRLAREDLKSSWDFSLMAQKDPSSNDYFLIVKTKKDSNKELKDGQILRSFDGVKIGAPSFKSFKEVLSYLEQQIDVTLGLSPGPVVDHPAKSGIRGVPETAESVPETVESVPETVESVPETVESGPPAALT